MLFSNYIYLHFFQSYSGLVTCKQKKSYCMSSKWLLFAVTNVFIMKLYLILFVFFYKHEYLLISLSTNSTTNCLAWLQTVSATFSNMPQFSRFKSCTVLGAKREEEQWPQKACKLLVGNVSLQTCFFRKRKKCFFDLNWLDLK